jgi:apolipoprotein N-acyltransferase
MTVIRTVFNQSWFRSSYAMMLVVFLLGLATRFAFAPWQQAWLIWPMMVIFLAMLRTGPCVRLSFFFHWGMGLGHCAWLFHSMHVIAGMPWLLAVLALGLFGLFFASLPTLAAYISVRMLSPCHVLFLGVYSALWVLAEYARLHFMTGFPFALLGYTQVPNGFLMGLLPLFGILAASYGVLMGSALLLEAIRAMLQGQYRRLVIMVMFACTMGVVTFRLASQVWTDAVGDPVRVSLVQGNVEQSLKFDPNTLMETLTLYQSLIESSPSSLVILPETAYPLFYHQIDPLWLQRLQLGLKQRGQSLLMGVLYGADDGRYANASILLPEPEEGVIQGYAKTHLVPFGEFLPWKAWLQPLLVSLSLPYSDFSSGRVMGLSGTIVDDRLNIRMAVNICYEDGFGDELRHQAAEADWMVNVTNLGWFGQGSAILGQHLQQSQARAIENGRMMLRATNTGMTAVIDHHGQIVQALPNDEVGVLTVDVVRRQGSTPYQQWGDSFIVILLMVKVLVLYSIRLKRSFR